MFNNRWTIAIQAEGSPITFISFSTSPSHSDTKGTVNGFQTGSSVYLITCEAGSGGCCYDGHVAGGGGHKAGTTSPGATLGQILGGAGQMSCRTPHVSPLLPP